MDLIREFEALIDVLNREIVEYAVCGGIAVPPDKERDAH